MKTERSDRIRASKVAVVATVIGMGSYALIALVFNFSLINHLTKLVDARLDQRLVLSIKGVELHESANPRNPLKDSGELDHDDVPILVWKVASDGTITALNAGAPRLPSKQWTAGNGSLRLGHTVFAVRAVRFESGWLVAGESLADLDRVKVSLINAEMIFGTVLVVLMFGASFVVGIRALSPIARAQRRQREFTADASHELRTPLSVIEAEVSIALSQDRDAQSYRSALERIRGEGRRLNRIVEDLLWLARSDGELEPHSDEIVDLGNIAFACSERFQAVAATTSLRLIYLKLGDEEPLVRAPRDSVDRLVGVLIDNACKYAGPGGQVEVIVATNGNTVTLEVDDSGPGIDPNDRDVIFDRFHRTSTPAGGTGLGLAIAHSIIRATQAHCTIGTASIGGAKFEISWRLVAQKLPLHPSEDLES